MLSRACAGVGGVDEDGFDSHGAALAPGAVAIAAVVRRHDGPLEWRSAAWRGQQRAFLHCSFSLPSARLGRPGLHASSRPPRVAHRPAAARAARRFPGCTDLSPRRLRPLGEAFNCCYYIQLLLQTSSNVPGTVKHGATTARGSARVLGMPNAEKRVMMPQTLNEWEGCVRAYLKKKGGSALRSKLGSAVKLPPAVKLRYTAALRECGFQVTGETVLC